MSEFEIIEDENMFDDNIDEEEVDEDDDNDEDDEVDDNDEVDDSDKSAFKERFKNIYDNYVKKSITPLAVIGGLIALFTTSLGKKVRDIAGNVVGGVDELSKALPKVFKGIGDFIGNSGSYLPFIALVAVALLFLKIKE